MHVILFEDTFESRFRPLTLTRPVYDLRIGHLTILEKWAFELSFFGDVHVGGTVRRELAGVFPEASLANAPTDGLSVSGVLWIQSRMLPTSKLVEGIRDLVNKGYGVLRHHDTIAAVWAPAAVSREWLAGKGGPDIADWVANDGSDIHTIDLDDEACELRHIWELFQWNGLEIERDARRVILPSGATGIHNRATAVAGDRIYMHPSAIVEPGCVLIAEEGPILLGEGSRVMAGAHIRGPFSLGEHAVVKMGAKIYKDTTIGPHCVVGGEVSNCLFHSYSNKGHEGYTGNSIFGQWVNLGADTNTSNLKTNYGQVRMHDWATGESIDTGLAKGGTIMGDHTKTGINTMLNTGSVIGVCNILYGSGYSEKFISCFEWVNGGETSPYEIEKALRDMERMMQRKDVPMSEAYKKMMKTIHSSLSFSPSETLASSASTFVR